MQVSLRLQGEELFADNIKKLVHRRRGNSVNVTGDYVEK